MADTRRRADSLCPTILPPRPAAELDATRLPPPPRLPAELAGGTVRPPRAGKRSGVTRVSRRPSLAPDTVRDVAWTVAS